MIRKDKKTFKDGSVKTQIRVTEGYRPFPNSSPKQRTIKSFGYLEDQEDQDAFWKEVHSCNDSLKKKRDLSIENTVSEMIYTKNKKFLKKECNWIFTAAFSWSILAFVKYNTGL